MTISDLFGAAAEPIELDGQTYPLRPPDIEEQYQFQRWLEDQARAAVGRDFDAPDPLARRDRRDVINAIAAGEYEYDGEIAYRARNTFTGAGKLLSIIHKIDHETGKRLARVAAERNMDLMGKAVYDADPKAEGAVLSLISRFFGLPSDFLSSPSSTDTDLNPSTPSSDSPMTNSGGSGAASSGTSTGGPSPPAS